MITSNCNLWVSIFFEYKVPKKKILYNQYYIFNWKYCKPVNYIAAQVADKISYFMKCHFCFIDICNHFNVAVPVHVF